MAYNEKRILEMFDELEQEERNGTELGTDENDSDFSDVDNQVIEQNVDPNSDSEESENEEQPQQEVAAARDPFYIGKDGETHWSFTPVRKSTQTLACNIITKLPGPIREAKQAKNEIDCFKLFFPDETINKIVTFTNIKIRSVQARYSRNRDARETDFDEICAYLGLLYIGGVCQSGKQNVLDLWRKDGFGIEMFRLTMGVNRFRFLQSMIRFDDVSDENRGHRKKIDKMFCVREMFECFVDHCKANYSHSAYITVDEMLPNFRGRCSFRVFMPQKPGKYGIKVWACSDAKTFYTSNMEIFIGNQPNGPYKTDNRVMAVVLRLVSHIQNSGRNVTTDNFFTSVPLAEALLQKNLTLVGTMRKNKKEIPPIFVAKNRQRPVPSTMFGFSTSSTICSFKPKQNKLVVLLSTLHHDDTIDNSTDGGKPEIVSFYNKTKVGVDTSDALQKAYSLARVATRWPLTIFFFMLNVGGVNSYIIFRHNSQEAKTRREFLFSLGRQLVSNHCKRRLYDTNISNSLKSRISEIFEFARKRQLENEVQEGKCKYCPLKKNRKTKTKCVMCNNPICREHTTTTCTQCSENNDEVDE